MLATNANMMGTATITFSQIGVHPPVFLVTSLSDPPWEALEMDVAEDSTASANLIFTKQFKHVTQGSYQYKIRLGSNDWIVDESQESTPDDHGNRNNVVHVKPESLISTPVAEREAGPSETVEHESPAPTPENCTDSFADSTQFTETPLVVQKASNKVAVSPEPDSQSRLGDKEETPLLAHEALSTDNPHPSVAFEDTAEDVYAPSTADYTSSSDIITTPSEHESQNDDELEQRPLLAHEIVSGGGKSELNDSLLLPHEKQLGDTLADESRSVSDDEDEIDKAPLLPHETGSSNQNIAQDTDLWHHGPYDDDNIDAKHQKIHNTSTPLLPHERDIHPSNHVVSKISSADARDTVHEDDAFEQETDAARELFASNTVSRLFRTRGHGSTLPHDLPRSDAEDENLQEPSLEQFPTNREQILERVKTIGLHIPEDRTIEDDSHSPQLSVLSQACSSADLAPTRSYASLPSVPETGNSEDENSEDVDKLPSPMLNSPVRSSDMDNEARRTTELRGAKAQSSSVRSSESIEAESISKTDGTSDDSDKQTHSALPLTATSDHILNSQSASQPTIEPLLLTESESSAGKPYSSKSAAESQTLQQNGSTNEPAEFIQDPLPLAQNSDSSKNTPDASKVQSPTSDLTNQKNQPSKSVAKSLPILIFGPLGRLWTVCIGDRKRAR